MMSAIESAYVSAVERAAASTVHVTAGSPWPPFRRFPRRGVGSGVVLDGQGRILTNAHVVEGAQHLVLTSPEGEILSGNVLGVDKETDIAVVQAPEAGLKPAAFGDSSKLRLGQPVLALGNPLGLPGGPTVTCGVVSALNRALPFGSSLRMIQTDAAVNPGSSGGPVIDLEGRVVALTTATIPFAEGIGFAIPANEARGIADLLVREGRVPRPWLGIVGHDVDRRVVQYYGLAATRGVFLTEISPGSPAATAGLQVGDVLLSVGATGVHTVADLVAALQTAGIGTAVEIQADRRGHPVRAVTTLGPRPY